MNSPFPWLSRGATLTALLLTGLVSSAEPTTNAPTKPPAESSAVEKLIDAASHDVDAGNLETAARESTSALELDPKNLVALDLRGTIYIQEKLWDRAERDYATLDKISPDPAYKYKLGQIRYLEKDYDNARPRFAALENDPRLGDLATYKVFLCDLLGSHEAIANRDLNALPPASSKPSFYYVRAAWDLYHNQRPAANQLFAEADHLFSSTINGLYLEALLNGQRFRPDIASFTTKDGQKFEQSRVFLETDGLRAMTKQGWVTLPLDQLPDDLSPFPEEIRAEVNRRRNAIVVPETETTSLSFTTKLGKTYQQVRWTLEDTGLDVLTAEGWIQVSFDQLPPNLTSFPPDLQKAIAEKRQAVAASIPSKTEKPQIAAPSAPEFNVVSFTTRAGKRYDEVRASLGDDGVRILTSDGWITVAFADLPADLSAFPADWRSRIQGRLASHVADASSMKVISFTSTRGKHFDEVRAALGSEGLRVLTSDGWIVVTYDQIPADLSSFPEAWREIIFTRQKSLIKSTAIGIK
jgi:hypothetical protein